MARDGWMKGTSARAVSGFGAGVLLAAGLVVSGGGDDLAAAAPPPEHPLVQPDTAALDDGYQHYVVEVPAPAPAPGATRSGAPAETPPPLDLEALRALGDRVDHLEEHDGHVYARLDDGTLAPVDGSDVAAPASAAEAAPAPAPAPAVDPVAGAAAAADHADHGDDGSDLPPAIAALADHPDVVEVRPAGGDFWAVTSTLAPHAFEAVAVAAGAESVVEDVPLVSYDGASNDTYAQWLWALENPGGVSYSGVVGREDADVDGVEARNAVAGTGVVVAVIDTGFQPSHPDLPSTQVWRNADEDCTNGTDDDHNGYVDDCNGWDFYNGDNTPYDVSGSWNSNHGTHVAGTIAAVPNNGLGTAGLAPGVTLMNLKTLQANSMWLSSGAVAIRYAVDNGAHVINASWGSVAGVPLAAVRPLQDAITYAEEHGVLFVAAAGNDGVSLDVEPHYPAALTNPLMLTVGAAQANEAAAAYSNRSATLVDLHAPGSYIVAPVDKGTYGALNGTSMAAPHVAAAAALVIASNPGITLADLISTLLASVDTDPNYAGLSATGGRLNAARAVGLVPDAGDPLVVTVDGANQLVADAPATLAVTTRVDDPAIASGADIAVRATLLTNRGGEAYGILDLPVTVDGNEAVTDDAASVALTGALASSDPALGTGVRTELGLQLPAGAYALAIELVDAADPSIAYGPAAVAYLNVPGTTPPPVTTPPTTAAPGAPTPTPTTQPAGGGNPTPTTQPGGGGTPTPTTQAPGGSTPTTQPGGGTPTPTPTTRPAGGGTPTPTTRPPATTTTTRPAGGGSPTPTTRPPGSTTSTTARPVTTTSTTRPAGPTPTTQPGGAQPAPQDPVTNDGITMTSVRPASGSIAGGNTVTITGTNFPSNVRVTFGGRIASLVSSSPTSIVVTAPTAPSAGAVDVRVADFVGHSVTMVRAYTYTGSSGGSPTPTTQPAGATTTTQPGGGANPTTTTTAAPAPTTTQAPAATTTTAAPMPTGGRARLVLGVPGVVANGLRVAQVVGRNPVPTAPSSWAALACSGPSCTARVG